MAKFITSYQQGWAIEFENLRQVLQAALHDPGQEFDIQHVGSTSIPGMIAKPILDIDIIIPHINALEAISKKLEQMGYTARGDQGIPGRFAFRQTTMFTPVTTNNNQWQEHHLYVCLANSLALKNHLVFRDALRNDHALAAQYAQLKQSITAGDNITREIYNKQKTAFIISVLRQAGFAPDELTAIADANS